MEERTKSLSTSFYKVYKIISFSLIILFIMLYYVHFVLLIGFAHIGWGLFALICLILVIKFKWYPEFFKEFKRLKDISYDSNNLYIVEKGIEEQIPFYEIKDVEIKSLNGIYQFNFFDKSLYDGAVRCKTSLWYPLNYKKVDAELNRVRSLIKKAKAEFDTERYTNRLPSN